MVLRLVVLAFVLAACSGGAPSPNYPPPRLLGPGEDPGRDMSSNPAFDYSSSSSDDGGCGPSCPANRGEGNGCVQPGEAYHGCGTPKSGGGRFRRGAGSGLPIIVAIALAVRRRPRRRPRPPLER